MRRFLVSLALALAFWSWGWLSFALLNWVQPFSDVGARFVIAIMVIIFPIVVCFAGMALNAFTRRDP